MRCVIITLALVCGVLTAPLEDEAEREFLIGNREFTANIYRELTRRNAGNLLVSPISVETVLSLAYEGARGQTANELVAGLSLPNSNQKIQWAYRKLLPKLQSSTDSLTLSNANRLYLGQNDRLEDNFKSVAVQVYGAGAENVDFSQSQEAADEINSWVEEQTNGRIQDLVDPSSINTNTRLILVNTLYLSAEWRTPFRSYPRMRGDFYINRNQYVEIDIMRQQQMVNYLQNNRLNAQFLELPLRGNNISMVIVLPNDIDGLTDLEENIVEVLQPQQYRREWVIVDLPRFSVQNSIEFVPVLKSLGIRSLFGEDADLSGISSTYQDLYVSSVLQKTYINVTEAGVEAAAATEDSAAPLRFQEGIRFPYYTVISKMKYFVIALTLTCGVLTAPIEEEAVREFLTGNRVLTANIYRELTKQNAGNLLVSPISVETVLSLAYEGARGQTAEELVVGLSLPNSNQKIQWAYRNLLPKLQSSTDSLTLSSANRVYLGQDGTIEDNFRSVAVQVYGAGAENVDFSQSQEAADEINTWVEEQTNGRVQNLVDPSNIDKDTRLILVNTLYLSAEWRSPFNSYQRIRGDFYINRDQYVKVEVMRQQQVLNYLQNNRLNAQFLELPLRGNNISMVIVLPNDIDGLPDLEENIAEVLQPQQYKKELVIVDLPRFSVQSSIEFVPVLENITKMKYYIISLALICGILTAPIENESVQEFLTGNRAFTANIYKQLIKQNPGNLLVSPLSLETVLALVYEGARGETADELMMGLSLPDSEQKIQTAFKSLLAQLQTSTDNLKLSSANKIYLGQGGIIEDPFKLIAEQVYSAGAENIDFSQTEAAADEINRWVEEQTDGRIQDLINPSSLDEDTKLVMVNSLYLSGQWKNPFDGYLMRRRNFHITKNEYVEIPLMSQQERFNYYLNKKLNAQFLELPLIGIGENISMVIVLPNEVDGLSALEANIVEVLEPQKYDQEWVVVELPRFSTLSTTEFVPLLQNLGIRRIFGEGANLTGISSTYQDLYVSNVLQKTYINVTEGGIESAAATQGN
ncbi:hypothetical protein NQ317_008073 [Molorchus minor]|uniref:Serpin domain-containing protein n=1 Tax=Molorchus minor TaxID=1323400 RepID=A0ABQ9JH60_9CUCU|nr:hypothetical protein NQ317_008073 [Molorchus minor]